MRGGRQPPARLAAAGETALCWGAGSSFPFTVPLPANTTQIAVSEAGSGAKRISALDDSGQVLTRSLLALDEGGAAPEFAKGATNIRQLVGGRTLCLIDTADTLHCSDTDDAQVSVSAQVEFAAQAFDGTLCYKSSGQLYCSVAPAKGGLIAGNGSAVGAAAAGSVGCAFAEVGKLVCWTDNGPTTVTDAAQVALGADFGCVLRKSGGVSCWGSSDGGRLGDGNPRPGLQQEPVDLLGAPTLALPSFVLLGPEPLGACDTPLDLAALSQGATAHGAIAACKEQCLNRLDSSECFASCAMPGGLTSGCFACYANLATCTGPDCYLAFQACAGYPVDFAQATFNAPRFECVGAACLHGKTVGQTCAEGNVCVAGTCSTLSQAPEILVCTAADGTSCSDASPYCACQVGDDFGRPSGRGYCGSCFAEGRTPSLGGDCYRDCTQVSYCAANQVCENFSNSQDRYCKTRY